MIFRRALAAVITAAGLLVQDVIGMRFVRLARDWVTVTDLLTDTLAQRIP